MKSNEMPMYEPTPEESARYMQAKFNAEDGIFSPADWWWWQQLEELGVQADERKRLDRRLNYIVIAWAAVTAAVICFAVAATKLYAK